MLSAARASALLVRRTAAARAGAGPAAAWVSSSAAPLAAADAAAATEEAPKKLFGTSGRYATALYAAAARAGITDTVHAEMEAFKGVLEKQPDFAQFLRNPTVSRQVKAERMEQLLSGSGKKGQGFSQVSTNLFSTMAANGRLGEASRVAEQYLELLEAAKGVVPAVVTTAEPLKKKAVDTIRAALQSMVGKGKQLDLSVAVDENIVGGLQVQVGDKFLDLSIGSRIAEVRRTLADTDISRF